MLARVDGAPAGTKGLSLFIVPKMRIDADGTVGASNDVTVASIEHKMGINGSATCVLNFGENDACVGELVGTVENLGMPQMFQMMNGARIAVGIQGLATASTAYLNALDYAKDRKQGPHYTHWKDPTAPRVPIIEHPDVRRMLLDMKSHVEGHPRAHREARPARRPVAGAGGQGRREGRLPPGPGRPPHPAGEGVRLGPGLPALRAWRSRCTAAPAT